MKYGGSRRKRNISVVCRFLQNPKKTGTYPEIPLFLRKTGGGKVDFQKIQGYNVG